MNPLHTFTKVSFFFISLSCLKKIQDKTALHLQCCQVCWHMLASKLKATNMSCTWRGLQLAFFPLSPMAASETSQQRVAKIRCIGCIGLGPIGCTYIYIQYIQCILAMRHFVARVPLSSCYGINRPRSTMIGSNKQRFMMLHDDFLFVPI